MRALAVLASIVVGWFITLVLIIAVQVTFGIDRSNPDVTLAALVGGVGLAILVARLVPRRRGLALRLPGHPDLRLSRLSKLGRLRSPSGSG